MMEFTIKISTFTYNSVAHPPRLIAKVPMRQIIHESIDYHIFLEDIIRKVCLLINTIDE